MARFFNRRRRLRDRIIIQRQSEGMDAMNSPTNEWGDVFETRAAFYPSPGTEKWASAQNAASSPSLFEVRSEARTRAILPSDRIVRKVDGSTWNIVAFDQPEGNSNIRIAAVSDTRSAT